MSRNILTALTALAVLGASTRAALAVDPSASAGVHDRAGMFSTEAVAKAEAALKELQHKTHWTAVIATVESLNGKTPKDATIEAARDAQIHGLYVLIAKAEHKSYAEPSRSAEKAFSRERIKEIDKAISENFRAKKFDEGLDAVVTLIREDAEAHPDSKAKAAATETTITPPTPATPTAEPRVEPPLDAGKVGNEGSMLPILLLGGGGILLALFVLSRLFRGSQTAQNVPYNVNNPGPGYGPGPGPRPAPGPQQVAGGYGYGPPPPQGGYGYGPPPPQGGGGFMSGVLGGAAGAVAGNILYDKFGRPHHEGGMPTSNDYPGGGVPTHGSVLPAGTGDIDAPEGPAETESYDPNAGAGGDWDTSQADNSDATAGDWDAPADDAATGGDWGGGGDDNNSGGGDDQGGSW